MKYKTFRTLFVLSAVGVVGGLGYVGAKALTTEAPPEPAAQAEDPLGATVATVNDTDPIPKEEPIDPAPATVEQPPTAAELKSALDLWLIDHSDRGDKRALDDILPAKPYSVKVMRFPDGVAEQWSNDPSQWSMFHIDLDRDGIKDEKWLLKNGRTYKREVLDRDGRVILAEYPK